MRLIKKSLKKSMLVAVSAMLFTFALTGCGERQESIPASTSVSWTETINGQEITNKVEKIPERAVSMSQATTEMMLALGLEGKMIGTAMKEEDIYPPLQEAYNKVKVLSDKWPSYETFMAENPDFATGLEDSFTDRGIPAEKISSQNISIFIPSSTQKLDADINTVFDDMKKYGEIFGVQEDAKIWIDAQKNMLESLQEKVKNLPKKTVFIYDSSDGQPFTVFKGYTTNILKLINIENVMENAGLEKTWAATNWESLIAANPEYIIVIDYNNGIRNDEDFQQKVDTIKDKPQLANVAAVKENHFIKVNLSEITPGVRTVESLKYLAEKIHGIKIDH